MEAAVGPEIPVRNSDWSASRRALLDAFLRLPPLFLMDSLLISWNQPAPNEAPALSGSVSSETRVTSSANSGDQQHVVVETGLDALINLLISASLFLCSMVAFLLETKHLVRVYLFLSSGGVIIWSFVWNYKYVMAAIALAERGTSVLYECFILNPQVLVKTIVHYVLQVFLGIIFSFSVQAGTEPPVSSSSFSVVRLFLLWFIFIGPTVACLFAPGLLSTRLLAWAPKLSTLVAHIVLAVYTAIVHMDIAIRHVCLMFRWVRHVTAAEGAYELIKSQWRRLQVPRVLRVFWMSRMLAQAVLLIAEQNHEFRNSKNSDQSYVTPTVNLTSEKSNGSTAAATGDILTDAPTWFGGDRRLPVVATHIIRQLLVRGCETTLSLAGMTSVVSVISDYIALPMRLFLHQDDGGVAGRGANGAGANERSVATISAILFFVLSLQSGLTGMKPEKRLVRLYQNACLLLTAILHFFHSIVDSMLQQLGASVNAAPSAIARGRHVRALLASAFLIIGPIMFLYLAWSYHAISTWLLALTCFNADIVCKVAVSLVVYALFVIDARLVDGSWEPFDDFVYATRTFGSCAELLFATILLLNGAWIFAFEQGGTIRALTIVFHAYFNVWTQAKQGWATSVRRREASRRLAEFQRATPEQLANLDDVCAICHHEMESAVVTECDHFYHVNCLRRWLFMQNHCPLCHAEFGSNRRRLTATPVDAVNPVSATSDQANFTYHPSSTALLAPSASASRRAHEDLWPDPNEYGAQQSTSQYRRHLVPHGDQEYNLDDPNNRSDPIYDGNNSRLRINNPSLQLIGVTETQSSPINSSALSDLENGERTWNRRDGEYTRVRLQQSQSSSDPSTSVTGACQHPHNE